MRVWNAAFAYLHREKVTAAMLTFLALVIVFSMVSQNDNSTKSDTLGRISSAKSDNPVTFEKDAQRKLAELQKHPEVIGAMALAIGGIFAMGILIQIVFIAIVKPRIPLHGPLGDSPWGVGDVFKAFVVLFFSECVIYLAGGFALGFMPDLPVNENAILMGTTFVRNGVAALYVLIYARKKYGADLSAFGIHPRSAARYVGMGLAAYVGFLPIYFFLIFALMGVLKLTGYQPPAQHVVEIIYQEQNTRILVAFGVFIAFIGPLFEELFFRGFMFRAFRKKWGIMSGIVLTSVLFAVMHAHWIALAPIFALSAVLCYLFEKTGSIVPGATLHMTHNLATLALMMGIKFFQHG